MALDIAVQWTTELGYPSANEATRDLLDDAIRTNPIVFPPPDVLEKAEFPRYIADTRELYKLYWEKFIQEYSDQTPLPRL